MKLSEVMTRRVEVIEPSKTLREAAQLMRQFDVGPIPVCSQGRVVGMITDRDIAVRAVAEGRDPMTTPVSEIMSTDVWSCSLDDSVQDAATLMADKQIRRLVVLDRERHLAGIVSLGDVAVGAGDPTLVGNVMEQVSQPSPGTRRASAS